MKEKSKRVFKREWSNRCVEYWTSRGYSEEEARERISEIQRQSHSKRGPVIATAETKAKMSKAQRGRLTLEYWIDKLGDEDAAASKLAEIQQSIEESAAKRKETRSTRVYTHNRAASYRCKEYWMAKGMSEEEAIQELSRIQSRGLPFYTNKYGEEEGTRRFLARNEKWRAKMKALPQDKLNQKRRENAHVGIYNTDTIRGIDNLCLYAIEILDSDGCTSFIKYGLTKHSSVTKRWRVSLNYTIIYEVVMPSPDALAKENRLNNLFKGSYTPSIIKTTECCESTPDNMAKVIGILNAQNYTNI